MSTEAAEPAATVRRLLLIKARRRATAVPTAALIILEVAKRIAGKVITESTVYGT